MEKSLWRTLLDSFASSGANSAAENATKPLVRKARRAPSAIGHLITMVRIGQRSNVPGKHVAYWIVLAVVAAIPLAGIALSLRLAWVVFPALKAATARAPTAREEHNAASELECRYTGVELSDSAGLCTVHVFGDRKRRYPCISETPLNDGVNSSVDSAPRKPAFESGSPGRSRSPHYEKRHCVGLPSPSESLSRRAP